MGYLIGITGSLIFSAICATLYTWKDFKNK